MTAPVADRGPGGKINYTKLAIGGIPVLAPLPYGWSTIAKALLLYLLAGLTFQVATVILRWPSGQVRKLGWEYEALLILEVLCAIAWTTAMVFIGVEQYGLAGLCLAYTGFAYVESRSRIAQALAAVGGVPLRDWMGRQLRRIFGRYGAWLVTECPPLGPLVAFVVHKLSYAVGVVAFVLLIGTGLVGAMSFFPPVGQERTPPPTTPAPTTASTTSSTTSTTVAATTTTTTGPDLQAMFLDVCGIGALEPGEDAPEWAALRLWTLYFGVRTGLGAVIAGCPEPHVTVVDNFDEVVYQAGLTDDRLRGIAAVSGGGRDSIVLSDAATFLEGQLRAGVAMSAFPRVNRAPGDLYVLWSRFGTDVFIRANKDVRASNGSYIHLPPAMVEKWAKAMRGTGSWLWPIPAADDDPNGQRHLLLYADLSGDPVSDIAGSSADAPASPTYFTPQQLDEIRNSPPTPEAEPELAQDTAPDTTTTSIAPAPAPEPSAPASSAPAPASSAPSSSTTSTTTTTTTST